MTNTEKKYAKASISFGLSIAGSITGLIIGRKYGYKGFWWGLGFWILGGVAGSLISLPFRLLIKTEDLTQSEADMLAASIKQLTDQINVPPAQNSMQFSSDKEFKKQTANAGIQRLAEAGYTYNNGKAIKTA